jgi:signal transduction histidine kinase
VLRDLEIQLRIAHTVSASLDEKQIVGDTLELLAHMFELDAVRFVPLDAGAVMGISRLSDEIPELGSVIDRCLVRPGFVQTIADRDVVGIAVGSDAVLIVVSQPWQPFSRADVQLFSALGAQVGRALDNARSHRRADRQNRHLQTLNAIFETLGSSLPLESALDSCLQRVIEAVGCDWGSIYLRDEDEGGAMLVAQRPAPSLQPPDRPRVSLGQDEVGRVFAAGQSRLLMSLGCEGQQSQAILCVPLRSKSDVLGVLKLGSASRETFAPDEMAFLETLGRQMGVALENVLQLRTISLQAQHLSTRAAQFGALLEISTFMARGVDLDDTLHTCVEQICDLLGVHCAGVLLDAGDGAATVRAIWDRDAVTEVFRGVRFHWSSFPTVERALRSVDAVLVSDDESSLSRRERVLKHRHGVSSTLLMRLGNEAEPLGVLAIWCTGGDRRFRRSELDFCRTIANQIAIAVERARLFGEVREFAQSLEARVEERTQKWREANQKLQELTRERADFLSVISHELRTPMSAILGFSEILGEPQPDLSGVEQQEYARLIHQSGKHLLRLIDDLLDLADSGSAQDCVHVELLPLEPLLSGVVGAMSQAARRRGVCLELSTQNALSACVLADRGRIKQVLYNLLSNAIKFSPAAGLVTIEAERVGGRVRIAVQDQGPGIRAELQEKIFEPFYQVDQGHARNHEGAGLGLALARRSVRLHGSELRVISEPGRGSCFEFTLELADARAL